MAAVGPSVELQQQRTRDVEFVLLRILDEDIRDKPLAQCSFIYLLNVGGVQQVAVVFQT